MNFLPKNSNEQTDFNMNYWCKEFNRVWQRSDWIFSMLHSTDDYYRRPVQCRLPLIFYLGHLPCFTWKQFHCLNNDNDVIDTTYDDIFLHDVNADFNYNSGYIKQTYLNQSSIDRKLEEINWHIFTVESVIIYRNKIRTKLSDVLKSSHLNFNDTHTLNILNFSTEHEMLHQENLLNLFTQLPIESFRSNIVDEYNFDLYSTPKPLTDNSWIKFPGGRVRLGRSHDEEVIPHNLGSNNVFSSELTYVSVFEMQSHPIRNADFLDFVLDNGYTNPDWWDEEVFTWILESNIQSPITWNKDGNSYKVNIVMQRNIPIEDVFSHPVIVSHTEAKAYCRWLSKKIDEDIDLPTESEWIYAMWDATKCIKEALSKNSCNIDFKHLHTMPISSCNEKQLQWQGSAFEWTSSCARPILEYRSTQPICHSCCVATFDTKHFILLGGSFATDSVLIRRTFRNWFDHTYRYIFSTFRCVKHVKNIDSKLTEIDRENIIASLSNKAHRKISSEYIYDAQGSALFTQITEAPEYYPFKQELKLLCQRAYDLKSTIIGHSNFEDHSLSAVHFIELGCGDGKKLEAWLRPWVNSTDSISMIYHPVDISQHAIESLLQRLKTTFDEDFIDKHVKPICCSFENISQYLNFSTNEIQLFLLLGSTIGNFSTYDANDVKFGENAPAMKLIRSIRQNLRVGDWFICSFDMCKDTTIITQAYSDSKGVNAAFTLNLLARLNRELNFNFNLTKYQHHAFYNPLRRQVETWLLCLDHEFVTDSRGFKMELKSYDAIQTEVSTKYTKEDIESLLEKNSMKIIQCFAIDQDSFPYSLYIAHAI